MRRLMNDFIFWLPPSKRPFLKHYTTILHQGGEVCGCEGRECVSGGVCVLGNFEPACMSNRRLLYLRLCHIPASVHLNSGSASLFCSLKTNPQWWSSVTPLDVFGCLTNDFISSPPQASDLFLSTTPQYFTGAEKCLGAARGEYI